MLIEARMNTYKHTHKPIDRKACLYMHTHTAHAPEQLHLQVLDLRLQPIALRQQRAVRGLRRGPAHCRAALLLCAWSFACKRTLQQLSVLTRQVQLRVQGLRVHARAGAARTA